MADLDAPDLRTDRQLPRRDQRRRAGRMGARRQRTTRCTVDISLGAADLAPHDERGRTRRRPPRAEPLRRGHEGAVSRAAPRDDPARPGRDRARPPARGWRVPPTCRTPPASSSSSRRCSPPAPNCCSPAAPSKCCWRCATVSDHGSTTCSGDEDIATPFGPLATRHLRPRRVSQRRQRTLGRDLVRAATALPAGAPAHPPGRRYLRRPRALAPPGNRGAVIPSRFPQP